MRHRIALATVIASLGAVTVPAAASAAADLSVSVTSSAPNPRLGEPVGYTVRITNVGDAATQVWVVATLENLQFDHVDGQAGQDCRLPPPRRPGRISCRPGLSLGPGATIEMVVDTLVGDTGTVAFTAIVRIDNGTTNPPADANTANDQAGVAATVGEPDGSSGTPGIAVTPKLSRVALERRRLRPGGRTWLRFRLDEDADVKLTLQRRIRGAWTSQGRSARTEAGPGTTRIRFRARLRSGPLRPGRYRLLVVARNEEGRSQIRRASFRVVP